MNYTINASPHIDWKSTSDIYTYIYTKSSRDEIVPHPPAIAYRKLPSTVEEIANEHPVSPDNK